MNTAEKRRKELLEKAQSSYRDRGMIPAVHPRFQSSYAKLYETDDDSESFATGTFGIRLFICALLFALFVAADYKGTSVLNVDSKRITQEITYELDVKEVWKGL